MLAETVRIAIKSELRLNASASAAMKYFIKIVSSMEKNQSAFAMYVLGPIIELNINKQ